MGNQPIDVTTDAAGFAVIPLDYGEVIAAVFFSSTVASTSFNLVTQDLFNMGATSANYKAFRDSSGVVKFSAVPITSLAPVVFNPQDMAPLEGLSVAIQLSTAEAKALKFVKRKYV